MFFIEIKTFFKYMSAILNWQFLIFLENLISNTLLADSKTLEYEVLNYRTDIKVRASEHMG